MEHQPEFLEGDDAEQGVIARLAENDRSCGFTLWQVNAAFGDGALHRRAIGHDECLCAAGLQIDRRPHIVRQKGVSGAAVDQEARTDCCAPAGPVTWPSM